MTYRAIIRRKCPKCKGEGTECRRGSLGLYEHPCSVCHGKKKVEEELEIIKITTKEGNKEVRII